MQYRVAAALAVAAFGLRLALQPAERWTIVEGRILLDEAELGVPHHPPLMYAINALLNALPTHALRWLIPLEYESLHSAAQKLAASRLNGSTDGSLHRLLSRDDLAPASQTIAGWPAGGLSPIAAGLDALLADVDGAPGARSRPHGAAASAGGVATLSPLGRFMAQQQVIGAMSQQMMLSALLARPELGEAIRNTPLRRPIVIVGPPRTGTTYLHRLLACHPGTRHLPYFEALESVAPLGLEATRIGEPAHDARVGRTDQAMEFIHLLRPLFSKMHVMGSSVPFEDMQLSGHCFSSLLWDASIGDLPTYSAWYAARPQEAGYLCIRRFLQLIERQHAGADGGADGGARELWSWVLKTPQHALRLKEIHAVFPDAVVVHTARDGASTLRSLLPMLSYALGVQNQKVELAPFGADWMRRVGEMMCAQQRDRHLFPDAVDAPFDSFVGNSTATLRLAERVLRAAGLATDAASMAPLVDFLAAEDARVGGGSRAQFRYDVAAFGLTEEKVRAAFAAEMAC